MTEFYEKHQYTERNRSAIPRILRYFVAFKRSFTSYNSDMGGWKERLQWEVGYADGEMGMPARITQYDHPYEHGYYCAKW